MDIDELTDRLRRRMETDLAPGVRGWIRPNPNALEIPSIRATNPGAGDVARYLDTLPTDRTVIIPLVTNPKLAAMLERRGFRLIQHYFPELDDWGEAHVRKATT